MEAHRSIRSLEMFITLEDGEIDALDRGERIAGQINIPGDSQYGLKMTSKPLIIKMRRLEHVDDIVKRILLPRDCTFDTIEKYYLSVSKSLIDSLRERGTGGDRIHGDKILFYSRTYGDRI